MIQIIVLALPLALAWMLVTAQATPDSFAVGYVFGLLIMAFTRPAGTLFDIRRLPMRFLAFVTFSVYQLWELLLSSIYVARRALARDMRLKPGIIAVPTQDETGSELIAALSAHSITLTPGELVIDFERGHTMYVHCLDVEASAKTIFGAQARRLKLLNRILRG